MTTFQLSSEDNAKRLQLISLRDAFTSSGNGRKLSEIAIKHGFNATKFMVEKSSRKPSKHSDACR